MIGLCERDAKWLETVEEPGSGATESDSAGGSRPGSVRIIAVVEPEIVRAGVVRALGAPEPAFWRVDVPPLAATEFSGRAGRWNVRVGRALGE
ncbi:hypothetical protein [Streptomyces sp. NPDC058656]|uniref:hypothetical protein n=1 Tax=Streptomyces sp. NPDC058656 TaxID=3346578 RepID=UPI0036699DCB